MNTKESWAKLFSSSSFFCLKKSDVLDLKSQKQIESFDYKNIATFHPGRKNEFLLGRFCASKAHELHFGSLLMELPAGEKRAPLWPSGALGSITHNEAWVGAAVSDNKSLLGVGIDFEVMGRVKIELEVQIRSVGDLKTHKELSDTDLLTLIFSAKESLYKALYPTVNCFFGFDAAAVKSIDIKHGVFEIVLIKDIAPGFGPLGRFQFKGKFKVLEGTCLTVIEISSDEVSS